MTFNDKLPFLRKSYDRHYYNVVDNADELKDVNRYLARRGEDWHFIGQGTKVINNGIYVPEEKDVNPIKVDYVYNSKENPEIYNEYFREARKKLARMSYSGDNRLFLPWAVAETVSEKMKAPDKPLPKESGSPIDDLSEHMLHGGSSLHRTVACAALLDAFTPGVYTTVETGTRFNQDDVEDREIRRWVRYEDPRSRGEYVVVIDMVDGICGTIEDVATRGGWDRRRPEDKARLELPPRVPAKNADFAIISLADHVKAKKGRKNP